MIVLLTPSGARPHQIELCSRWMQNQDYTGEVVWIIIDDAAPITTDFITEEFRKNWHIKKIYPSPLWQIGQNTQGRNIAAGINYIKTLSDVEAIFIIEDDDYYKPFYLTEMVKRIEGYELIGEVKTIYYNVTINRWIENQNMEWSSLFQTAFTPEFIPTFESCYGEKFIDLSLFRYAKRVNLFDAGKLSIGIKGQLGRKGIGAGHGWINHMHPDEDISKLKELIGEDWRYYERTNSNL